MLTLDVWGTDVPVGGGSDLRRAPRAVVDIEAELHLSGLAKITGTIQDLSYLGSLFVPDDQALNIPMRSEGRTVFALPAATKFVETHSIVRRLTTFPRAGREAHALGIEFTGVQEPDQHMISDGCTEWPAYRIKDFSLSARCFVQGTGANSAFTRFGKLARGSRQRVYLTLPTAGPLEVHNEVKLKIGLVGVTAEVDAVRPEGSGEIQLDLRLTSWGRDFFVHEARRQST